MIRMNWCARMIGSLLNLRGADATRAGAKGVGGRITFEDPSHLRSRCYSRVPDDFFRSRWRKPVPGILISFGRLLALPDARRHRQGCTGPSHLWWILRATHAGTDCVRIREDPYLGSLMAAARVGISGYGHIGRHDYSCVCEAIRWRTAVRKEEETTNTVDVSNAPARSDLPPSSGSTCGCRLVHVFLQRNCRCPEFGE